MTKVSNPYLPALKDALTIDTKYGYTMDMASLRYRGPTKIFLWDDLQDQTCLSEVTGLSTVQLNGHIANQMLTAQTVQKFVPWYSLSEESAAYQGFCVEEYQDLEWLHAEDYVFADPLPLRGKLFDTSLSVLSILDAYYENQRNFNRVEIEVRPNSASHKTFTAFAWLNDLDQLTQYNVHMNEYEFLPSIDVTPFSVVVGTNAQEDVYSFK